MRVVQTHGYIQIRRINLRVTHAEILKSFDLREGVVRITEGNNVLILKHDLYVLV